MPNDPHNSPLCDARVEVPRIAVADRASKEALALEGDPPWPRRGVPRKHENLRGQEKQWAALAIAAIGICLYRDCQGDDDVTDTVVGGRLV